ncbi:ClpP/crotonase-like domain-containing protein [Talaromyces proteolyticus]|uniref:ClpP/crotonase-like domain-containing protein n=1 Tax=Talaromyces proteolyticus TaxID=1131652 RepID=A0AAD4KX50_9EURO|nr:ClpP/crotonase-like domain-containing protein [Talaromyces proteolyticus]KAH8701103.1 ClpP/crotonase-like domain-containing protein [Talaromyces proteolyticus]
MSNVYKHLEIEPKGDVFIVTLRNGEDNRLNFAMCKELMHALGAIRDQLKTGSDGALIVRGHNNKFFTNGIDLEEAAQNPEGSADSFYPLLHAILDFPFPTIAIVSGHTFGGGCPFSLAFDYRIMNSKRGFWCMVAVDFGLHFPGIGSLVKSKLTPRVARKVLLEGHKFTGKEALADGIVDQVAQPEELLSTAMELAEKVKSKGRGNVYGLLRAELNLEPLHRLRDISYVHNARRAPMGGVPGRL